MPGTEAFTLEEVADMLGDLLSARGFDLQRTESLPLDIGGETIAWCYPAIVMCKKTENKYVLVCRFGPVASLPGYLTKYLDATEVNIASAFDDLVALQLERGRDACAAEIKLIEDRARKFREHAEKAGLSERKESFGEATAKVGRRLSDLEQRSKEVLASKNLDDLEDLRRLVDEGEAS